VANVLRDPRHPYTAGLLRSLPATAKPGEDLFQIPGTTPSLLDPPPGCPFRPRCQHASELCVTDPPLEMSGDRGLRCFHPLRGTVNA
ncbi:MAG: methionine ABC transporter ATP-binding protein, partial [Anderseniella sp.]|nr:methionine ABC transporter ATP-binding protein [Anderseniella sp.]